MWVRKLLDISHLWGVLRGDSYDDGDGKFYLETNSFIKALATLGYFMLWSKLTGGATYMVDNYRHPRLELQERRRFYL